jgi:UDP-3-O-[3-hydroxymyristoyl] glucosamine N-acyltransferase
MLTGIAPLQTATAEEVSFLDNRKYLDALRASRAGAVIIGPGALSDVPPGMIPLVSSNPYEAWARVAAMFFPPPPPQPGIHPTAVVAPDAVVDPRAEIGPYAVIGARAEIGPRCRLGAHVVIEPGVLIGADCRIGAHVTVSHAVIGQRVVLYPGVRIGQDGFGFAVTARGFLSVPQLGRVLIEDDVEIGANTTVDRGSAQDTRIGAGSRLDNQVQIGHNVSLGRACVVVAQAGISGSTIIGDFVMIGGQAGFAGHLEIGTGAKIGAQAGVMANVPAGAEVVGAPAMPVKEFFRMTAFMRRLAGVGKLAANQKSSARRETGQQNADQKGSARTTD